MEEEENKHSGGTLSWNLEMAILQGINLIRFNKQIKGYLSLKRLFLLNSPMNKNNSLILFKTEIRGK